MSAVTYRAITRGQTPDGVWHDAGALFTTDAPEGGWMQPLDEQGRPIPKEKKQPAPRPGANDEAIAIIRQEIADKAKIIIAGMQDDFDAKLKAETARADAAEKALSDYKAEAEQLLRDADASTDKATQRAEAAEKERDALKADAEKAKAAPAAKAK